MIGNDTPPSLDMARKMPDAAPELERAFESIRNDWARIGKTLQTQPTGHLGHMPHCGSFGSDFGIMLAWSAVCAQLADAPQRTLVVCDDPWMFRHLASGAGVKAEEPPSICWRRAKLFVRGYMARIKVALSLFRVRIGVLGLRANITSGDPVILVYGHPNSDAAGQDAYFGDLMQRIPSLKRLLHTDAGLGVARRLGADHRTASLHAWGRLSALIKVPFQRWRVNSNIESGQWRWLIDRSAAIENSGGGPAMNFWQQQCQRAFLAEMTPTTICWPWENHCWERDLCRASHADTTHTVGYQHTVIGPHQFNYAAETNYDGGASLPDVIACDGPAYLGELTAWGAPSERLQDLGALRFTRRDPAYASAGAVFVPLSAIRKAAEAQLHAA